jgi:hypothetical protein
MLVDKLLLARLVTRKAGSDFVGAKDDTIDLKIAAILDAREYGWRNDRSSPIVTDDLTETSIPVTLNKDPYSAIAVTDEQLTLDIVNFAEQVLNPQLTAVATKLDGYVGTLMSSGVDYDTTLSVDEDTDDLLDDLVIPARKALNLANIPADGRYIVLGADVEAWALKHDLLKRVDESGTSSVLRSAIIGQLYGFQIIGNVNGIDADKAYAFHRSAYVFANMAPAVPQGATAGASASFEGFALRWIKDYDAMYLRDRSVVSSFAGTASVEDTRDSSHALTGKNSRAVEIDFTASS